MAGKLGASPNANDLGSLIQLLECADNMPPDLPPMQLLTSHAGRPPPPPPPLGNAGRRASTPLASSLDALFGRTDSTDGNDDIDPMRQLDMMLQDIIQSGGEGSDGNIGDFNSQSPRGAYMSPSGSGDSPQSRPMSQAMPSAGDRRLMHHHGTATPPNPALQADGASTSVLQRTASSPPSSNSTEPAQVCRRLCFMPGDGAVGPPFE